MLLLLFCDGVQTQPIQPTQLQGVWNFGTMALPRAVVTAFVAKLEVLLDPWQVLSNSPQTTRWSQFLIWTLSNRLTIPTMGSKLKQVLEMIDLSIDLDRVLLHARLHMR